MALSMTSVTQKASIRTTTSLPYNELRRIHKWQLEQDARQSQHNYAASAKYTTNKLRVCKYFKEMTSVCTKITQINYLSGGV